MKTLREFLEDQVDEAILGGEKYKGKDNPNNPSDMKFKHYDHVVAKSFKKAE